MSEFLPITWVRGSDTRALPKSSTTDAVRAARDRPLRKELGLLGPSIGYLDAKQRRDRSVTVNDPIADDRTDRVRAHTEPDVLADLDAELARRLRELSAGGPEAMTGRLQELDRESDIERILEMNASALAVSGLVLGVVAHRRWLGLPAVVLGFLLQHAIQGWCPPIPVLRRLGLRTRAEIDAERFALKYLRGDFASLPAASADPATAAIEAVRR